MRYNNLFETILNLSSHNFEKRMMYADQVWSMLQYAYADIGGFLSAANVTELAETPGLWKLVRRKHHITAVIIYKASFGRKLIGAATDGTGEGKSDLMMILNDDKKLERSWAEVSGRMEGLLEKWVQNLFVI